MRRTMIDLTALREQVGYQGYSVNEPELLKAIKSALRFRGSYSAQVPSTIIEQRTSYPVIGSDVAIGHFTDIAPWNGKRCKWVLTLGNTPSSSIVGQNASFYQLHLTSVEA